MDNRLYKPMIDLNRLRESDLFGRFFLRAPGGGRFAGYYSSLEAIRPLLKSEEWTESVTGFYVNVAGDFDAVRVSYWTISPEQTRQVVDELKTEHGLEYTRRPGAPGQTRNSDGYGGEEFRFRKFLVNYTQIGLDIMAADLFSARCLFATFRWRVMRSRQPYKPHFEETFQNNSPFYASLKEPEKDQFWLDIAHWPNPPQVDWAHMMVNMVLGCDWNAPPAWNSFLSPQRPLSIQQINEALKDQGFQIPPSWQPLRA